MMDHLEYVGQIVGDYRLQRWLGGGGFGNVYLAEQIRDGQQVAVKVLQMRLTKQNDLRAFINEARTFRLRHPHIVPLLDFGLSCDDTPFLVMEYAPKGTLRDRHPKGTHMPLLTAVEYSSQVASALQYAHDSHLVHRDVKPGNMLVRADGLVLLSDFGIVTAAHSTYSLSANQGMVGTVPYMAPEQLAGKPRAASDQYALAVVIYEWVAGKLPFRGTAVEIAMQHATQPPPSLRAQVPEISQEVEAVLFKALAKNYKERFPSIQAFITALQYASSSSVSGSSAFTRQIGLAVKEIAPSPVHFPPMRSHTHIDALSMGQPSATQLKKFAPEMTPSRGRISFVPGDLSQKRFAKASTNTAVPLPVRKRARSKRLEVLLIILMVLLIVGGSYAYQIVRDIQAAAVAHQAATAAVGATATAVVKLASDPYDAAMVQHGIMFGFDSAHTRNNPYEHTLNSANVAQLHQAWSAPIGDYSSSSPAVVNGIVYIGSNDYKLHAFTASTGQQKWAAPTGGRIASSPAVVNGSVYVGSQDRKLYAFDATTGQQRWSAPTGDFISSSPAVVNGMVYVGSQDRKLYAFDATTGQQKWSVFTSNTVNSSPAVVNGVVYVGSSNGKLYALDASTGQQKWSTPTGSGAIYSSPTVVNNVVYVGSTNDKFYAFDAATGQQRWSTSTGNFIESSPAVANDMVYIGSSDSLLYAFDTTNGQQKWAAPTGGGIESSPSIANGVVYVGSFDHKLYAFDASTGQERWSATTGDFISSSPVVANGVIYVSSFDHKLYAFALPKKSV